MRRQVPSPRERGFRTTTQDLVKHVLVLCFLAMCCVTMQSIPHLQNALDASCCSHDIPILSTAASGVIVVPRVSPKKATKPSCLQHLPFQVNASRVKLNQSNSLLSQPWTQHCGRLRRSWNNYELLSPLAIQIQQHQSTCSAELSTFHVDNAFGLGSHLYMWSQAVCNAQESGHRVRTHNPVWLWMDQAYCDADAAALSPLLCYFPQAEFRCGLDELQRIQRMEQASTLSLPSSSLPSQPQPQLQLQRNVSNPRQEHLRCQKIRNDPAYLTEFRAAAMEYLFHRISPVIIQEAQRQVGLLFGGATAVPKDLIAVHIRYGDKFWEMDLAPASEYTDAVTALLHRSGRNNRTAAIYLSTEDPRAVDEFLKAAEPGWEVYVDRTVTELNDYRPVKGNRASWTTRNTKGRAGLVALGSLLVAMEANDFVLTTKSNWSRLMNELRKNVLDPRCGNCTRMIDLRPGEW